MYDLQVSFTVSCNHIRPQLGMYISKFGVKQHPPNTNQHRQEGAMNDTHMVLVGTICGNALVVNVIIFKADA